jgi:DNA-binding XRE family transcriptional regulator
MARSGLRLSAEALAKLADVSRITIVYFEAGKRNPHPETLAALRTTFEKAGVEFIRENGGAEGIRIRKGARQSQLSMAKGTTSVE